MTQSVFIREATEEDLSDVLRLYQQPSLDNGASLPLEDAIAFFHKIQQYPSYRLFVAELNNQVVGTFMLLVMDNLLHLGTASAIVEAVAVDPQLQSQGIGRQMMHRAMAEARAAGCYKLVLSSNQTRDRAHAFYEEKLGFQLHGYSFYVELPPAAPGENHAIATHSQSR